MSTARLKRKLGDLGIDTSSRKANENFCLIGTPLPPLEKSKDTGEFVPLWKQEVRDEKGRRRLHGAFTGGFSAGYFNTVGSKEGWTPSTFISSRSDRATNKNRPSRPEDFMDEEDLTGMRDDQKLVDEHEQMDLLGGTQNEMSKRGEGPDDKDAITLALERSLLPAPKDSVGARILKKMGWRIGQGIGPRITWRQREMALGRDPDVPSDDIDEEAKKHVYAPRDMPLIIVERKDNFHGLGYDPGLGLHASLGVAPEASKQSSRPRLAGGFGLGALNDADDDDLDVYDHSQIHGRNHHAYDANDVHDEERVSMSSRSQGARDLGKAAQLQRPSTGQVVFRDGRQPLNGFVISEKPVAEDLRFPIPDVPTDWTPNPKRVWEKEKANSKDKENTAIPPPSQTQSHSQWKTGISANQRGAALGETPLPSAPRSIFEYISKKDQERIKNIAGNRFAPPSTSDDPSPGPSLPTSPMITHTEPHVAQAALHGFQPFMTDPPKQARYTAYLRAHANPGSGAIPPTQKSGQSPEEFAKEISDYAKSAALFRPVSGAMAGRFTSAAVLDLGPKIIEGLHTPAAQPEEGADSMDAEEKPKEEVKEEAPKVHAARLGMYGVMTREVCMWQPARLLCKRFGVKDPDLEVPVDTSGPSAQAAAPEFTDTAPADEFADASAGMTQVESGASGNSKRDVANIGLGEDDGQGNDVLTYERPGMDIFKAIFASDDEESDEEKDHMDDVNEVDEPPAVSAPAGPSKPGLDVKPLPANGIVEDVDLATFKPTFIPRGSKQKDAEKKDKKNKKQKSSKGGALVSFDVDEDGGESLSLTAAHQKHRDRGSERPRKKRRKDREGNGGEDMWVEKPPPDIVKALPINLSPDEPEGGQVSGQESGPPRARKRAIDFM